MSFNYSQIAFLVYLTSYILMFLLPVIILKRRGIDVRGTLKGIPKWSLFAYFISFISFLWIPIMILYVVNAGSVNWFLEIPFLNDEIVKIIGIAIIGIGFLIVGDGILMDHSNSLVEYQKVDPMRRI